MAGARSERPQAAPAWEPRAWMVALGCCAVACAFCAPVLASGERFGIDDWDQQLFYAQAARRSLAVYGQVPAWNPWYCGGSPLLANPSSWHLDPLFLATLAFGLLWGAKVQIVAHQILAMLGAWLLARRLGATGLAGLLAPVVYGLSSAYTLHVGTGHAIWFAWAWLPFAAAFACGAVDAAAAADLRRAGREALLAGLFAALLLFAGNAYFFVYQALFTLLYGVLVAASSRPAKAAWRPLAGGAAVAAATFGFAAVKLLPMAGFLGSVSRYEAKDASGATPELIWLALAGRDQSLTAHQLPGMQWRWWEYGAYVGLVPLVLALAGLALPKARPWRFGVVGLFFLLLAMGNGGPVWPLLRGIQAFEGLRVPARAIAFVVLAVSCLAALGATAAAAWARDRRVLSARATRAALGVLLLGVTADLFLVARSPLQEAFTLPPIALQDAPAAAPFTQVRGRVEFKTRQRYTDLLDHAVANRGVVNCYERLHLPIAAQAEQAKRGGPNPDYRGEAWIDGGAGTPTLAFSPNRLVVDVPAASGGVLVVNQNHDPGWKARVRGAEAPVASRAGVLAVALPSDGAPARVELEYGVGLAGTLLSLATVLAAAAFLGWERRARARAGAAA